MGKVVATVGVIVGAVALAATGIGAIAAPALAGAVSIGGISASTLLFAGAALQAVGQALIKRPKLSGSTTDRLNASLVTDALRKMVFGRTALNTDLRYQEWWGRDQEYCSQVFVVASHWCESIDEIWLDDKLAWSAAGGVTGEFAGYLSVAAFAQAMPGSVFRAGWSGRWGANAVFAGCATLYLQFKVTGNGKKGKSPFSSTITSRVTVVGKGARLPDPRFDSTLGGAGAVRLADQTTWAWAPNGYESGRNPALALLFYLIGWRIQNPVTREWKLAVGRGVPIDRIDIESFITAANLCDEPVTRADGTTEPRYRCDGTFSEEDDPAQVIAGFEACMNGKLRDSTGRFALQVLHNDLATPVVDFTDDDVLGDFNWSAGNNLNDRRNVVRGRLTDPASLYQLVDFPAVRIASVDGIERIDSVDLALVQSPSQGQRLAKQRLQRAQYQGAFSAEFNARGWAVKDGDIVRLTFSALGFDRKLFRVSEGVIDPTGVVPLVLVEEHQAIYAWDRDERAAVQAAEPNEFNPLLLPIIVAIDEAGKTAEWPAIVGEGKPDDYATNSGDPNSPFGPVGTVAEALATLDRIEPIAEATDLLKKANIDQDAILRQADRDRAQLAAAQIAGLLDQNAQRITLRDAGMVTDPQTGRVYIYAVDQTAERVSKVQIGLDAVTGQVALRATYNDVAAAIAQAQLSPGDAAELGGLISRMNAAEVSISGLTAAIALKADAVTVTQMGGIVQNLSLTLDALAGTVATKVSYTDFTPLRERVGAAEQTLLSYGDVSSYGVTLRQAEVRQSGSAAAQLADLLTSFETGQRLVVRAAEVQQQLYARLVDGDAAEAASRLLLTTRVGDAEGRIANEEYIRASETGVLTRSVAALSANFGDAMASISQLTQAVSDGDSANARSITQLSARIGDFGLVSVQQAFAVLADRTGKIEGTLTVAIDTDGNVVGTKLIGSTAGPGSFNLINADLKMGTGRIIFRAGIYEKRGGANFGKDGNLLEWYGPAAVPLGQETIANSRFATAADGKVYYGGADLDGGFGTSGKVKQLALDGLVGGGGSATTQLAVAAAVFPSGGKIKISGRITTASASNVDGGAPRENGGYWTIRFYANYGSGPQLIATAECSVDIAGSRIADGVLGLSGYLFNNPGPGGPVNLSATVQRGGDPNSGIASQWTGSAIVEWVNA